MDRPECVVSVVHVKQLLLWADAVDIVGAGFAMKCRVEIGVSLPCCHHSSL